MRLLIETNQDDDITLELDGSARDIVTTIAQSMAESDDFENIILASV